MCKMWKRKDLYSINIGVVTMKRNKVPIWWYAGFKEGFFHGCKIFVKSWFWSYSNPIWTIRDKLKRKW